MVRVKPLMTGMLKCFALKIQKSYAQHAVAELMTVVNIYCAEAEDSHCTSLSGVSTKDRPKIQTV